MPAFSQNQGEANLNISTAAQVRKDFLLEHIGKDKAVEVTFLETNNKTKEAEAHSLIITRKGSGFIVQHHAVSTFDSLFQEHTVTRQGKLVERVPVEEVAHIDSAEASDELKGYGIYRGGQIEYRDRQGNDFRQAFDKLVAKAKAGELELIDRKPIAKLVPAKELFSAVDEAMLIRGTTGRHHSESPLKEANERQVRLRRIATQETEYLRVGKESPRAREKAVRALGSFNVSTEMATIIAAERAKHGVS